ncbi:SPJ_0845 family protein [Lactobacillus mulieris]|nr:SPJ_0845 family protein [Lactobacillus mulieris]MDT9628441.1 SPJ_0845 family protein [Lactobacillus mulieris]
MGLTFKREDELEKMLNQFAIFPDDPKQKGKKGSEQKPNEKNE